MTESVQSAARSPGCFGVFLDRGFPKVSQKPGLTSGLLDYTILDYTMKDALTAFDQFLEKEDLSFSATVIGATALIVMGVIDRATVDVDCLKPAIPADVARAARRFAKAYKGPDGPLREDWLNNGPEDLKRDLPKGWEQRTTPLFTGKRLKLTTLGRSDLLRSKLFAYCDRQQDLKDCIALKPTTAELRVCLPWLEQRDANPDWPEHVRRSIYYLAERLGHDGFDA